MKIEELPETQFDKFKVGDRVVYLKRDAWGTQETGKTGTVEKTVVDGVGGNRSVWVVWDGTPQSSHCPEYLRRISPVDPALLKPGDKVRVRKDAKERHNTGVHWDPSDAWKANIGKVCTVTKVTHDKLVELSGVWYSPASLEYVLDDKDTTEYNEADMLPIKAGDWVEIPGPDHLALRVEHVAGGEVYLHGSTAIWRADSLRRLSSIEVRSRGLESASSSPQKFMAKLAMPWIHDETVLRLDTSGRLRCWCPGCKKEHLAHPEDLCHPTRKTKSYKNQISELRADRDRLQKDLDHARQTAEGLRIDRDRLVVDNARIHDSFKEVAEQRRILLDEVVAMEREISALKTPAVQAPGLLCTRCNLPGHHKDLGSLVSHRGKGQWHVGCYAAHQAEKREIEAPKPKRRLWPWIIAGTVLAGGAVAAQFYTSVYLLWEMLQ